MNILVTGAKGMVGTALCNNLKNIRDGKNRTRPGIHIDEIYEYDLDSTAEQLDEYCKKADFVFKTLLMPKMPEGSFAKKLYSLYLTYLPAEKFKYSLKMNVDHRGSFTELLHTADCGQVKRKAPITITDPNMTRFLMNLDEAVDLVAFAFEHAEPGDLFVQKADASTIGDLAKGVMKVFGETECKIIGSRHGEKLYETLVTREEMLRSVDMGHYYRIAPDARGLNYDKFYVQGTVTTEGDEAYTSHNTNRLDVDGVVKKIMETDYVKEEVEGRPHSVEA